MHQSLAFAYIVGLSSYTLSQALLETCWQMLTDFNNNFMHFAFLQRVSIACYAERCTGTV